MLRYEFPGPAPARLAFTSLAEGNLALHVGDRPGDVLRRRRMLESGLGLAPGSLRFMNQTHSVAIHEIAPNPASGDPAAAPGPGTDDDAIVAWGPDADAMISPDGSAPMAVMVADCLPVVFAAARNDGGLVTAVAHAGRKGLLGGILQGTVEAVRAAGGRGLRAWIGPAVCGACYEVPVDLAAAAETLLAGTSATTSWGTASLDLPGAAERLLADLGVEVTASGICTLEDPDYFSYRRDPKTGRLAGIIWPVPTGTAT